MRTGARGRARRLVAVAVVAVAFGVGACQRARGLRVMVTSQPSTFDPHHHNEIAVWSVLSNVCDSLVRFTPDMHIEPALAVSWRQEAPNRVRFELRSGVRFHDGSSFSAADVVASFERARSDPNSAIRHHLVGIESMRADGATSLIVETAGPSPTLLNRLAFLFVVPATQAALPRIEGPIGTGPYQWMRLGREGSVKLLAADGWRGRPEIPWVLFNFGGNEVELTQRLLAGQVDLCDRLADTMIPEVQQRADLQAVPQPSLVVQGLLPVPEGATGPARHALANPDVRRAMLLAIDRRALVNRVYQGHGVVASQLVHPAVFGYDPALEPVPYDPGQARKLLEREGFGSGFDVTLGHGDVASGLVEGIVSDLAAVGIRVRAERLPFGELITRMRTRSIGIGLLGRTCTTGDASEVLDSAVHSIDLARGFGGENYTSFAVPEVDAALEAATVELDPARRLELLQRAQARALEATPVLPLFIRFGYLGAPSALEVVPRHDGWLWLAGFSWKP